ncbi:MAG: hypothetical protein U9R42_05565, partial [Bacteroidota bacterium]|nr:hypothetical protein [Bacteroidota bacterium]
VAKQGIMNNEICCPQKLLSVIFLLQDSLFLVQYSLLKKAFFVLEILTTFVEYIFFFINQATIVRTLSFIKS